MVDQVRWCVLPSSIHGATENVPPPSEMSQKLDGLIHIGGSFGEPDDSRIGLAVDLPHKLDLIRSFVTIVLVDAYRIYPEPVILEVKFTACAGAKHAKER